MLCDNGYWRSISHSNIRNSITSAGFSNDFKQGHIAKHDVYGNGFIEALDSSGDVVICPRDMEAILQEDEHKKVYIDYPILTKFMKEPTSIMSQIQM